LYFRIPLVSNHVYCCSFLGDESTQDEYGTAAYKMVELDDKLHGAAVQHREVQGKESDKFAKYFNYKITYLKGGVESGFTHVEPTKEEPHLYRLKGVNKTQMTLTQLPVRRDQMNAGDVFVLVAGEDHVWLWIGAESNNHEKTSKLYYLFA
jgi:gelsolin